ncbi:MAG: hypothetical protein ACRCZY_06285 [Phocaeicola sp.]
MLLSKDDTEARWVEVTIAQMNEEVRIADEARAREEEQHRLGV